ncbi:MAG: Rpn family recombination-promoting nuclease/putative transposase [Gammaproteobacteria bacterium]
MNQIIHQPEDKFFKQSLSDIRVAKDFFEEHLPPAILNQLDLNSLKLQNQTFIDEAYKNTEADIVYKANFNQQSGFIYTLLEHQSKTDHYMALRLLSYCLRIIEQHRKQNPKKPLPIVYSGSVENQRLSN